MSDAQTLSVYDQRAADYAAMADAHPAPELTDFIARLAPGARVLDLGCGPGRDSARMAAAGLNPDPVDASPQMVSLARAQGLPARLASFDDPLTERYDAVWASFSLLHAPRAALPGHLAAIHAALKPKGLFFLGLKLGEGEKRDALGRFYTYYTRDALHARLADTGFTLVSTIERRDTGLSGSEDLGILILSHA
ncbi:class I SAM-dependent DNA methyltransferase [Pararhodobacter zhoushanensis]|uniref:class I SAM-dependent DNA methyltransferase n=1 Tax=Pararhodobacter zhoushanensis TaxID=2479545 RepID=UPI000F8DDEA0|nr:class I SAM-dependent methyltransferase [Pararhodobacter zhoushanensis]